MRTYKIHTNSSWLVAEALAIVANGVVVAAVLAGIAWLVVKALR